MGQLPFLILTAFFLRYNQLHISRCWHMYTPLNHHHNQAHNHMHNTQKFCKPLCNPLSLCCQPQATTDLFCHSRVIYLEFNRNEIIQSLLILLRLISLTIMFLWFIYVYHVLIFHSFLLLNNKFIVLLLEHFVWCSVDEQLECFQFKTNIKKLVWTFMYKSLYRHAVILT